MPRQEMPPDTEMRPLVMRIVREAHRRAGSQDKLLEAIKPLLGGIIPNSASPVSNWESGTNRPTAETLLAIAKVSGISIDEVLFEKSLRQELVAQHEEIVEMRDQVRALADLVRQLGVRATP